MEAGKAGSSCLCLRHRRSGTEVLKPISRSLAWPGPWSLCFLGSVREGKQGSVLFLKARGCLGPSERSGRGAVLSRMWKQHVSAVLDSLRPGLEQGAKFQGLVPHRAGAT